MVSSGKFKRFSIAAILIFIAVTANDGAYVMESTEMTDAFSSQDTIRCAIVLGDDMYGKNGLVSGFNYELLLKFAQCMEKDIEIVKERDGENYMDSLKAGTVDIVAAAVNAQTHDSTIMVSLKTSEASAWGIRKGRINELQYVNSWIRSYGSTPEYADMKQVFSITYNPMEKAGKGARMRQLSPYDGLIKKYAATLGWDWRMLAAVVYQESRFSINAGSGKGAEGLMQVLPSTAGHYGISDLTNPEENIKAGTMHLKHLQGLYEEEEMDEMEKIRFILASYNAGEGRIAICRDYADGKGADKNKWSEIVKAIGDMRTDPAAIGNSPRSGKFYGYETIGYVDRIMELYEAFCTIIPA